MEDEKQGEPQTTSPETMARLGKKVLQVSKRPASEVSRINTIDAEIQHALGSWRSVWLDANKLLKIPEGIDYSWEEMDLAGWSQMYSDEAKIPVKVAFERIYEYLKRGDALVDYIKGIGDFGESILHGLDFAEPRGWIFDPATIGKYIQLRSYQANHFEHSFKNAVQALGWG